MRTCNQGPPAAAVNRCHSWRRVDVGQPGRACRTDPRDLTRAGFNWFSLDYRLSGLARFEDSLADIRAALAFIRCHAADFRIDPNRLVLLGEDSGAQLAALLAAERRPGVIGAVLIGGFLRSQRMLRL